MALGRAEAGLSRLERVVAAAAILLVISAAPVQAGYQRRVVCGLLFVWALICGGGVWAVAGAAARRTRTKRLHAHAPRAAGGTLALLQLTEFEPPAFMCVASRPQTPQRACA